MVSLDEFKRAFAGQAADNGLPERDRQVKEALKRLDSAVGNTVPADGIRAATKKLVERYAATRDKTGGPAAGSGAELDQILRNAQAVAGRIKTTPVAVPAPTAGLPAPAMGAPAPTAGVPAPPTSNDPANAPPVRAPARTARSRTGVRTKVAIVADFDALRSAVVEWVERNVSRSRATALVNASNLRDVHDEAVAQNLVGAEVLADLKAGAGGIAAVEFKRDPKFQQKWWEPKDKDYLPMIYEVFDAKTGKPIKGAKVRFPSGNAYVTDENGRIKTELIASKFGSKPVELEISAPGYGTVKKSVTARSGRLEGGARLEPVDPRKAEKMLVRITARDGTDGKPIPQAKVTIGRASETTDKNGDVLTELIPGVHSIAVKAKGYNNASTRIDVRDNRSEDLSTIALEHTVLMTPSGGADIYVRVLDSKTKKPIVEAGVRLDMQAESTDIHGEATFVGIPFGEHRLWVGTKEHNQHDSNIIHATKSAADFHVIELDPI
jgi:hypothetical protein